MDERIIMRDWNCIEGYREGILEKFDTGECFTYKKQDDGSLKLMKISKLTPQLEISRSWIRTDPGSKPPRNVPELGYMCVTCKHKPGLQPVGEMSAGDDGGLKATTQLFWCPHSRLHVTFVSICRHYEEDKDFRDGAGYVKHQVEYKRAGVQYGFP